MSTNEPNGTPLTFSPNVARALSSSSRRPRRNGPRRGRPRPPRRRARRRALPWRPRAERAPCRAAVFELLNAHQHAGAEWFDVSNDLSGHELPLQIRARRATRAAMARVIITIPGPWEQRPRVHHALPPCMSSPPSTSCSRTSWPSVASARCCPTTRSAALRKAPAVLEAEFTFEKQGDRAAAAAAARLAADAFAAGADGRVRRDLAAGLRRARRSKGAEFDDAHTLFHLFVEVLLDDEAHEVVTEGLQCFDLPDVCVPFEAGDPEGRVPRPRRPPPFPSPPRWSATGLRPPERGCVPGERERAVVPRETRTRRRRARRRRSVRQPARAGGALTPRST
jgi:hypothetical protein